MRIPRGSASRPPGAEARPGQFLEKENVMDNMLVSLLAFILGAGVAAGLLITLQKQRQRAGEEILSMARQEAETLRKQALINAREEWLQKENRRKADLKQKEKKLQQKEQQLKSHEAEIRGSQKAVQDLEMELTLKAKMLDHKEEEQKSLKDELKERLGEVQQRLESISGLTMEEARHHVLDQAQQKYEREAAELAAEIRTQARENATREARETLITTIEKMAADSTSEATIKEVEIPNNRIKGMVIGREGRNIKSFEAITGTKIIVDETPDTIVISCFDPVRREIARQALDTLIKTRNFSPRTIQDAVTKATRTVENQMNEAAGKVLKDLHLNVHPDLKRMLGRLRFRTSYGQNVLDHSKEVARIAGSLAAELGLDVMLAKRAGLLHDVGKADSNGSDKSHVAIGVEVCKRVREHPIVINSVMAHHNEAPPIDPISELVTAADIISSSRPGVRRDSVDSYTKRVEMLEGIAGGFPGVHRVYALYAGREIRVVAESSRLDDVMSEKLSSDIAEKISQDMQFPGQIKVVVIRESRAMATAV
jgi:ribonuclease Y